MPSVDITEAFLNDCKDRGVHPDVALQLGLSGLRKTTRRPAMTKPPHHGGGGGGGEVSAAKPPLRDRYLARLGYSAAAAAELTRRPPNHQDLCQLVTAHLLRIPFENLDQVVIGNPRTLDSCGPTRSLPASSIQIWTCCTPFGRAARPGFRSGGGPLHPQCG